MRQLSIDLGHVYAQTAENQQLLANLIEDEVRTLLGEGGFRNREENSDQPKKLRVIIELE